jgi:hypothetical protein
LDSLPKGRIAILLIEAMTTIKPTDPLEPSGSLNKRPLSVTLISTLFLLTGLIGFVFHASDFRMQGPLQSVLIWVCLVRLLGVVCAVFMLRAANWARWLAVIWLAYHILLSAVHSTQQLVVHSLLLAVIAYFLFRAPASVYFRGMKPPQNKRDSTHQ